MNAIAGQHFERVLFTRRQFLKLSVLGAAA
jgi:hypothetical protein